MRHYGEWMRNEAEKRIGHLYPKVKVTAEMAKDRPDLKQYVGKELTVIAWLWARTVKSPNPAFRNVDVPLVSNFMLSKKRGKEAYVEPVIEGNGYRFTVKTGKPKDAKAAKNGTKLARGANFRCIMSGATIPGDYIKKEGRSGRMGARLMAIVAEGKRGRVYLSPTPEHEAMAGSAQPTWRPEQPLHGKARDQMPLYGMETFADLFTPRQLVALTTFSDLVQEARERVKRDAVAAGLPDDGIPLRDGGTGATAYAEAIAVYLAFAIDRMADFNCSLSSWKPSGQQQMHLFGRQAVPMVWDYAEANVFSDRAICWHNAVEMTASSLEVTAVGEPTTTSVRQLDAAASLPVAGPLLLSTDPPYYNNIGYADLSDFFYVWLRRSLQLVFPDLFATVAVPKAEELVATPYRTGGDAKKARDNFEDGFRRAFTLFRQNLDPRFPMTVYYAYKQSEEDDEDGARSSSGWETMLESLVSTGFEVTATWPVRAAQKWRMVSMGTNALVSYVVMACRIRPDDAPIATRKEFVSQLRKELPDALAKLQQGNIAPVDFAQAAIGPGMAVFSRFAKVIEADGSPMTVRVALQIINQELDAYLAEQEGELDRETRFCVAWFGQHGTDEGEFGQADVLARAMNTAVNGLAEAGVLIARAGKVRLLGRDELPEDWDPVKDKRLTVWECTQQLIRALEQGGEQAAAALVKKLGTGKSEEARALSYRLYSICERKQWAKEALAYNGLVIAWPEILKLAESSRPAETGKLFGEE